MASQSRFLLVPVRKPSSLSENKHRASELKEIFFPIIHTNKMWEEIFSKEWSAELAHPDYLDRQYDESWNKLEDSAPFSSFIDLSH